MEGLSEPRGILTFTQNAYSQQMDKHKDRFYVIQNAQINVTCYKFKYFLLSFDATKREFEIL